MWWWKGLAVLAVSLLVAQRAVRSVRVDEQLGILSKLVNLKQWRQQEGKVNSTDKFNVYLKCSADKFLRILLDAPHIAKWTVTKAFQKTEGALSGNDGGHSQVRVGMWIINTGSNPITKSKMPEFGVGGQGGSAGLSCQRLKSMRKNSELHAVATECSKMSKLCGDAGGKIIEDKDEIRALEKKIDEAVKGPPGGRAASTATTGALLAALVAATLH